MRFFGRTSFKNLIFYGPHRCGACGQMICKAAIEQGGQEYDYPSGPIYPNTQWRSHVCSGHTAPSAEEQAKARIADAAIRFKGELR